MSLIHTQLPLDIGIEITAGDDVLLPFQLTWVLPDGSRHSVDLSYYQVISKLHGDCYVEDLPVTVIDASQSVVKVTIPSSVSIRLENGWHYYYTLELLGQGGEDRQIGRGRIRVRYSTHPSCC